MFDTWTIPDHPDLIQPDRRTLARVSCCVSVMASALRVTCSGTSPSQLGNVYEEVIEDARRIEAYIDSLSLQDRVDHGIATQPNCVSAPNFPERFSRGDA